MITDRQDWRCTHVAGNGVKRDLLKGLRCIHVFESGLEAQYSVDTILIVWTDARVGAVTSPCVVIEIVTEREDLLGIYLLCDLSQTNGCWILATVCVVITPALTGRHAPASVYRTYVRGYA